MPLDIEARTRKSPPDRDRGRRTLEIRGWHPPCPYKSGCSLIMEDTAITTKANIYYFGVQNGKMVERVFLGGEGYMLR